MAYNHLGYSYSLCCRCDVGDWTQGLPHVRQVHDSKLSYTLPRWFSYAVAIHLFLVKYAETEAVSSATSCVGYRARTPVGVWSCFVSPLELCLWPTSAGLAFLSVPHWILIFCFWIQSMPGDRQATPSPEETLWLPRKTRDKTFRPSWQGVD